jgi:hypothetical protein
VFNFLPKDDKFFDQQDNLARMLVSAAQQLSAILQTCHTPLSAAMPERRSPRQDSDLSS